MWGCESPGKTNKMDFLKLLNFWDGQAIIEDSTIDLDLNVIKERHPTKKHSNTDTSSAISGKESIRIMKGGESKSFYENQLPSQI